MSGNGVAVAADEFGRADGVVIPLQGDVRRVLPEVVDDLAVEAGREDAGVLADMGPAAVFVDVKQSNDDPPDDADTGVLPAAALVVGDDRRRHVELGRQIRLCDFEVRAPLP